MIDSKTLKNELHSIDVDRTAPLEQGKNLVHTDNFVIEVHIDLNLTERVDTLGGSPHGAAVLVADDFTIFDFTIYDQDGDPVKLTPFDKECSKEYLEHTLRID